MSAHEPLSTHKAPQIFMQASCETELFLSVCDEQGIDHTDIMERHALDGDPYSLALALAATAQAIRAVGRIIKTLLDANHPIKLTATTIQPDGESTEVHIAGTSRDDFPAVEELLESMQRHKAATNDAHLPKI